MAWDRKIDNHTVLVNKDAVMKETGTHTSLERDCFGFKQVFEEDSAVFM